MKAKFSAPIVPQKNKKATGEGKDDELDLEHKYDKNMAWGTPRLVRKGDKDGIKALPLTKMSIAQR